MRVDLVKFEFGMQFFCTANHLSRKINPYSVRWLHCSQQSATAATNFKYALVWTDVETIDFGKPTVIPAAHASPGIALARDLIPMCSTSLLVDFSRFVKGWVDVHSGMILPEYLPMRPKFVMSEGVGLDPDSNAVIIQ